MSTTLVSHPSYSAAKVVTAKPGPASGCYDSAQNVGDGRRLQCRHV